MDDTTHLQVEFPVGSFTITVREPSAEQMFVLGISRQPRNDKEQGRLVERLVRILERLTGDQWFTVIESKMIDEELSVSELLTLVEDIIRFPWAEHHKAPEPADVPAGTHLAPGEPLTEVVPQTRPAPRVVGGA